MIYKIELIYFNSF